jgi:hypothetical protein
MSKLEQKGTPQVKTIILLPLISFLFNSHQIKYVWCSQCYTGTEKPSIIREHIFDLQSVNNIHAEPKESVALKRTKECSIPLLNCLRTQLAIETLQDYHCSTCKRKTQAKIGSYFTSLP